MAMLCKQWKDKLKNRIVLKKKQTTAIVANNDNPVEEMTIHFSARMWVAFYEAE